MVKATQGIRIRQIAKMVQKELGMLFLTETASLFGNAFISITTVDISSDLSLAKVYLSFSLNSPLPICDAQFLGGAQATAYSDVLEAHRQATKLPLEIELRKGANNDPEALLRKIDGHKNTIRRLLGKRIAGKMHKVPNLKFIMDRSVIQCARVTALMDQIDLVEK